MDRLFFVVCDFDDVKTFFAYIVTIIVDKVTVRVNVSATIARGWGVKKRGFRMFHVVSVEGVSNITG